MQGHKLQSIKVQEVALIPHPCSDEPVVVYLGEPREGVGCEVCGMLLEEAAETSCPGSPDPSVDVIYNELEQRRQRRADHPSN